MSVVSPGRFAASWLPVPALGLQLFALLVMPAFLTRYLVHTDSERHAFLVLIVLQAAVLLVSGLTFRALARRVRRLQAAVRASTATVTTHDAFMARFDAQCALSLRYGNAVTLVRVAIDGFARGEGRHGSSAGAQVLTVVVELLARNLRSPDVAASVEPGEFEVLLPETPTEGAWVVAERIRRLVADAELAWPDGSPVTLSFGLAAHPDVPCGRVTLFAQAEGALAEARQLGGNRIAAAPVAGDPAGDR